MLVDALINVKDRCARLGLGFALAWSEAEDSWYAHARGIGAGEYFEVKRAATSEAALERLAEKLTVYEHGLMDRAIDASARLA
jgi:hypothetical protein